MQLGQHLVLKGCLVLSGIFPRNARQEVAARVLAAMNCGVLSSITPTKSFSDLISTEFPLR